MDFTPDLIAFRGVLTSLNNVHPFCKLMSRAGNEEKLDHLISTISRFMKDKKLIGENGNVQGNITELNKLTLFIVLNTDFPALEEMVSNEHMDSVVWAIPTITKFLMTYVIIKLRLESFMLGIISFCYPQLSVQVAAAVLDNIKWMNPEESLPVLSKLGLAVYHLICRLHFFNLDNDVLSDILTSSFNSTQLCLNFFTTPPNAEKLEKLKKDAEYQYKGERLSTMLYLLQKCVNKYKSHEMFITESFDGIYELTYKPKSYDNRDLNFEMGSTPNKVIGEYLDKCLLVSLDKCKELVMDVSVDIFCAWSEFKMDRQEMQRIIGEQSYKLCIELLSTETFAEHPVISMLQQISRKPKEVRDVINDTDTDVIVENIMKSDVSKSEWVEALLYKKGIMSDAILLEQLALNIDMVSSDDAYNLYEECKENVTARENAAHIKLLAVKAFQRCSRKVKYEILDDIFKDYFINNYETLEFSNMMTEIFNKIINSQNVDLSEVLCVFFQNPQKVYEKILSVAAGSSEQGEVMVKVLELIYRYSKRIYQGETSVSCLFSLVKDFFFKLESEVKQRNFISFICGIKENSCITDEELLHVIIMPNLHRAMIQKDMRVMNVACKILYDAISLNKLMECKTPMLAMLAQVADVARWSVDTFHGDRVCTLQTVILLQNTLVSSYSDDKDDENELVWLKSKLSHTHPLNRYYYRTLWDRSSNNFIEQAQGPDQDEKIDKVFIWLSKVLCQAVNQEWYLIWESLDYFDEDTRLDIFSTVVHVLIVSEKMARKGNTWNCMLHVFENYISVIRYKYLAAVEEPLNAVSHAIDKIAYAMKALDETNIESIRPVLMPLVAYLVEHENDYNINVRELLRTRLNLKDITSNGNS